MDGGWEIWRCERNTYELAFAGALDRQGHYAYSKGKMPQENDQT